MISQDWAAFVNKQEQKYRARNERAENFAQQENRTEKQLRDSFILVSVLHTQTSRSNIHRDAFPTSPPTTRSGTSPARASAYRWRCPWTRVSAGRRSGQSP